MGGQSACDPTSEDKAELGYASHVQTLHSKQVSSCIFCMIGYRIYTCERHWSMFLLNKFLFLDSGLKNNRSAELLSPRKKLQASELDVEGVE